MLSSSKYEWLCNMLLGVGTTFMMVGCDMSGFVVESVLESVNKRNPGLIDRSAGYNGQAVIYAFHATSCMFAALIVQFLGSRRSLFLGSVFFTTYLIGFLFVNRIYYYLSCGLMGVGFSLFHVGQGAYLTEHSTKTTIQRNSALFAGFANLSMIFGSPILIILSFQEPKEELNTSGYHEYSDKQINWIFGCFTACALAANFVFLFLLPPQRPGDATIVDDNQANIRLKDQIKNVFRTLTSYRMMLLAVVFMYGGVYTAFWFSIYPTTLTFTRALTQNKQLPGLYALVFGIGVLLACISMTLLSRRFKNIGKWPSVLALTLTLTPAIVLVLLSTPNRSSIEQNDDDSLSIAPNAIICLVIAGLLGVAEVCFATVRSVLCATLYPDRRAEAFAVSKMYQSLGSSITFFASSILTINYLFGILLIGQLVSVVGYFAVARKTQTLKKCSIDVMSLPSIPESKVANLK